MAIEFKGLDNVLKAIDGVVDIDAIEGGMGKACALVERTAKQTAPKDTGTLRNSITSRVEKNGSEIKGIVFTPEEYAPYVEYGTGLFAEKGNGRKTGWAYEDEETGETIWTRGQRPHPFLRPALNDNRKKIIEIIGRSVKNG